MGNPYEQEACQDSENKVAILAPVKQMVELYRQKEQKKIIEAKKIPLSANQKLLQEIFAELGESAETIDVYNPSEEFELSGETYLAGRAESRESEINSHVIFFKKVGDGWEPLKHPVFKLQDPSVTKIGDEIIFSGVELELRIAEEVKIASYKTVFYRGQTLDGLTKFAEGPDRMKDIRLVELSDGQIGVYTRPQGGEAGRGQIGFTIINSLAELVPEILQTAPLLPFRFPEGEWGGANQAILLPDDRVFILGHRAYFDKDESRKYYPCAFIHHPQTHECEDLGILAERSDFPAGPAKRNDIVDVLFAAGIKLTSDGYILKTGLSDTEVGEIEISHNTVTKN